MLLYQVEASKIGEELAQLKGEGNLTKPAPQAPSSANSFIFPEDEPESESSGGDGVSKELESMQLQLVSTALRLNFFCANFSVSAMGYNCSCVQNFWC